MSDKSLFAVLLRSPWWVSFLLVVVVALVARALLPDQYTGVGMLGGFPFFVIGCLALWRQRNDPSAAQIGKTLESLAHMNWGDFSAVLEIAFTSQGYAVTAMQGPADLGLEKKGVVTVVSAKRWKAAAVGVEHLRELVAQREMLNAHNSICISLGQVSEKARLYAAEHRVTLLGRGDLVSLMAKSVKSS
jgi:restriction system protein